MAKYGFAGKKIKVLDADTDETLVEKIEGNVFLTNEPKKEKFNKGQGFVKMFGKTAYVLCKRLPSIEFKVAYSLAYFVEFKTCALVMEKNGKLHYMNVKDIAEAMEMEYSGTARVVRNLIKKVVIGQLEVGKYDNQTTHKIYVVNPYIYINGQNPDEDTLRVFFDNTGWKEFMSDVD